MRSVSNAFKATWQAKQGQPDDFKVFYKRPYWNGAAFVYEPNWNELDKGSFKEPASVPMATDSPLQNVVTTAVVTLPVDNSLNQWVQSPNYPSIFAADGVSGAGGYRSYKTMFQFRFGYLLAAGWEWTNTFTGLLIKPKFHSDEATCDLQIASNSLLLEKCDAEKIGVEFTGDVCTNTVGGAAYGDGTSVTFETPSTGVDHLDEKAGVIVDGVVKGQGIDWTVGNTNQVAAIGNDGKALITLAVAPGAGKVVKATGLKWPQNQDFKAMMEAICDLAGIGSTMRNISPIAFEGASAYAVINSKAQWDAGTLTDVDTVVVPDSILPGIQLPNGDFETGDFTDWTLDTHNTGTNTASGIVTNTAPHTGTYSAEIGVGANVEAGPTYENYICVVDAGGTEWGKQDLSLTTDWAQMTYTPPDMGGTPVKLRFVCVASDGAYARITSTNTVGTGGSLSAISLWIKKPGVFTINAGSTFYVDGIVAYSPTTTGNFLSAEIDLLAAPLAWGAVILSQTLNGGTVTITTQTSTTPGSGYDALAALDSGGIPTSALKRYLKINVAFTGTLTGIPELASVTVPFITSTVNLALAKFNKMTGLDAMERLVKLPDYEMVFDGDGVLQVHSKTPPTGVAVELTSENGIVKVLDYDTGEDNVTNAAYVVSGNYLSLYDTASSVADGVDSAPTSEDLFDRVRDDEDYSDFLLSFETDITASRARALHDRGYRAKKKIRMEIWYVPWLEISDRIEVTIVDEPLRLNTVVGDLLQSDVGEDTFVAGVAQNVLANALPMKVLEYKPNHAAGTAEVYAEEILP